MIKGETADISALWEFEWWQWIYFWDKSVPHPEDKEILGEYLSLEPDIGNALTAKILEKNGNAALTSTYRAPTLDETHKLEKISARNAFDQGVIYTRFRKGARMKDFAHDKGFETPEFEA